MATEKTKELAKEVLDVIQTGSVANGWRRTALCYVLGCPDRSLRKAIAYLVSNGVPVCVGNSGGYYLTTKPAELEKRRRGFRKRLRAAAIALRGLGDSHVAQMVLDKIGEEDE